DSRVYLVRGDNIKQLTSDHSLVSEQMRAGLISENDAKKHKLKNIITRSVGYQEEVEIDVQKFELLPHDKIVLCSDGLTNMVDDENLRLIIHANPVEDACRKLIGRANDNGGEDNITVVVCGIQ
ncbi:MAG TPA: SpoIIE family protein phosphatase, partial [bacterium]|nr:SpoIIE family protein phosphatase [bacterium]